MDIGQKITYKNCTITRLKWFWARKIPDNGSFSIDGCGSIYKIEHNISNKIFHSIYYTEACNMADMLNKDMKIRDLIEEEYPDPYIGEYG